MYMEFKDLLVDLNTLDAIILSPTRNHEIIYHVYGSICMSARMFAMIIMKTFEDSRRVSAQYGAEKERNRDYYKDLTE